MVIFEIGDIVYCDGDSDNIAYEIIRTRMIQPRDSEQYQEVDIRIISPGDARGEMYGFPSKVFLLRKAKREKRTRNLPEWF